MMSTPTNLAMSETQQSRNETGGRIEGREISKVYATRDGESLLAIDDISFEVDPGEFLCIVGPSGCGKSTLLRIILGLSGASGGEVHVGGEVVRGPRSDVGVV